LEQIVRDLALGLAARGHDPGVFCTTKLGRHADDLRQARIQVWQCAEHKLRVLPTTLIARLIRFAPDVIHAHGGAWRPAAIAAMLFRSTPLIYTEHGREPDTPSWRTTIERWIARRTERITAVSTAAAVELRRSLRLRAAPDVIPNGVEPPIIRDGAREELRREFGIASEDVLALTVGRLEKVKDHALLIQAFASIADEVPKVRLAIAGDGSLRAVLREQAARLGLQNRIWLLGYRTDVSDWLRAADLFVLSSAREGLPLSLLDAMSHRLPAVATAVGGIPEVLEGAQAGVLVPHGDADALGNAIARLARDSGLRAEMGSRAQQWVTNFSRPKMIDAYCALYGSVVASESSR
jgi:glycosyltransferase involved in cell wall biosynthesis